MTKLVIAEKPMLARDIARAMCGVPVPENARLPIRGGGYVVAACAGHLLELVEPAEIDAKWGAPWSIEALPVVVPDWPKRPAPGKEGLLDELSGLLAEADCVIHAGDPDDEGQLIVDEVLDHLGYGGPVERVYVNDNIAENIRKAFGRLVPNERCRAAGKAAYARQMGDMCLGVSESRLATLRLHRKLNIGRVQTPTLGLVVARDEAIEGHVKRRYYELTALLDAGCREAAFKFKPGEAMLGGERHVFDRDALAAQKAFIEGIGERGGIAFEVAVSEKPEHPPLPYNLTALQADMSRRYGMSAARTQEVTQQLRDEYKAITYNRSDCQYLKEEHFEEAPRVMARAMRNVGANWPLDYSIKSKAFNDSNVSAHHGIIPQDIEVPAAKLTGDQRKVYEAVVERYAMQFAPPAVYAVSSASFPGAGGEGAFEYMCKRPVSPGWKGVFGGVDAPGEGDCQAAPAWLGAGRYEAHSARWQEAEKETAPPKPYTEGSLISDMASIAKYVSDPEVKAILKKKDEGKKGEHGGIGTVATRASIIEGLKANGYIGESKGKLRSTEMGRAFYRMLPPDLGSADTTARWWLIQQEIAEGKAGVNAIQHSVAEVFRAHLDSAYQGAGLGGGHAAVGKCPLCGQDVVQAGKVYTCASNRSEKQADGTWAQVVGCGFKLFPFCGKAFTPKQAEALLAGRKVALKGCTSKSGRKFDCKVGMDGGGKLAPSFDGGAAKAPSRKAPRRK